MKTYRIDMSATYLFSVEVDADSLMEAKDMAEQHVEPDIGVELQFLGHTEFFDRVRMSDSCGDHSTGEGEGLFVDSNIEKAEEITP